MNAREALRMLDEMERRDREAWIRMQPFLRTSRILIKIGVVLVFGMLLSIIVQGLLNSVP